MVKAIRKRCACVSPNGNQCTANISKHIFTKYHCLMCHTNKCRGGIAHDPDQKSKIEERWWQVKQQRKMSQVPPPKAHVKEATRTGFDKILHSTCKWSTFEMHESTTTIQSMTYPHKKEKQAVIRKKYLQLCKRTHPDKCKNTQISTECFKKLKRDYDACIKELN